MIYALTFFGVILASSLAWLVATGSQPKGIPLIVIWLVALGALFFVGYRRLYMHGSSDGPDKDSSDSV